MCFWPSNLFLGRLQYTTQTFPNLVSLPFGPQASVVIFDVGSVVQRDKISAVRALVLAVCAAVMPSLPLLHTAMNECVPTESYSMYQERPYMPRTLI